MKITNLWKNQGMIVGESLNSRSLPNWTRIEDMNGEISLIRALERPRGGVGFKILDDAFDFNL